MKLAGFGDLVAPGFATSSVSEQLSDSVSTQIKTFCNVSDIIIHFMFLGFERLLNVAVKTKWEPMNNTNMVSMGMLNVISFKLNTLQSQSLQDCSKC